MEVEITPEPGDDERAALAEALAPAAGPPEYLSAWRLAALRSPADEPDL